MDGAEALLLKPGDRVMVHRPWFPYSAVAGKVVAPPVNYLVTGVCVKVREVGRTPGGRLRPVREWACSFLSAPTLAGDPAAANVYADWLEENGEPRAAAKLRAAFPMANAEAV